MGQEAFKIYANSKYISRLLNSVLKIFNFFKYAASTEIKQIWVMIYIFIKYFDLIFLVRKSGKLWAVQQVCRQKYEFQFCINNYSHNISVSLLKYAKYIFMDCDFPYILIKN
jgi:hypothetical protein